MEQQVIREREEIISQIEKAGDMLKGPGWCSQWWDGSDSSTRAICGDANGHLFEELSRVTGHWDATAVE